MSDLADTLTAFAAAFTGDSVSLEGPDGTERLLRAELEEAADSLRRLERVTQRVAQLMDDDLNDYELLTELGFDAEPEFGHDQGLVDLVTGMLQTLRPEATADTAVALLDVINTYVEQAEEDAQEAAQQPVQQPVQQPLAWMPPVQRRAADTPAGRARSRAQLRPAGPTSDIRPGFGMPPIPANPGPFIPVTAEQLGMRRGPNGRYDMGDVNQ